MSDLFCQESPRPLTYHRSRSGAWYAGPVRWPGVGRSDPESTVIVCSDACFSRFLAREGICHHCQEPYDREGPKATTMKYCSEVCRRAAERRRTDPAYVRLTVDDILATPKAEGLQ